MAGARDQPAAEHTQQPRERLPGLVRHRAGEVRAEHRAADDVERHRVHLAGDVERLAVPVVVLPAVAGGGDRVGHLAGEPVNVALGEHRLHQLAVLAPRAFVELGHQAAAEPDRQQVVLDSLDVVDLVGQQHVARVLGVSHDREPCDRGARQQDVVLAGKLGREIEDAVAPSRPHGLHRVQRRPPERDSRAVPADERRYPPRRPGPAGPHFAL